MTDGGLPDATAASTARPDEAASGIRAVVRFTSHPSSRDVMANAAGLMRRSAVSVAVGTFITSTAVIGLVVGDGFVVGLPFLAFGLLFLSGLLIVPFVWWSIRQRRDLILAPVTVEADADGLTVTTAQTTSRQSWSVYRRVRETGQVFLLDIGTGAVFMLAKRGVAEADLAAFRGLMRAAGLVGAPPGALRRLRPVLWIAIGLIAALALVFGPRAMASVGSTATVDLRATVGSGAVTIEGTTDLPDGALITVEALQLDEWERASANGIQPDPDSGWMRSETAVVQGGRFASTLPLDSWPAGRGLAVAYFWIDSTQPVEVIERFGRDGERLRGPDITDDQDYGPLLERQAPFTIP